MQHKCPASFMSAHVFKKKSFTFILQCSAAPLASDCLKQVLQAADEPIILPSIRNWMRNWLQEFSFFFCNPSSMADRTVWLHPSAEDKPSESLLMQRHYCLQRKRKSFFVYIDTQCSFMEGPIVRQWLWESRAKLLLLSSSREGNIRLRGTCSEGGSVGLSSSGRVTIVTPLSLIQR